MTEIVLGLVGSIVMIVCWVSIIMNYERQKVKLAEREKSMYERCALCNDTVYIRKDVPVDKRLYYVDGAGQLCHDCYKFTDINN